MCGAGARRGTCRFFKVAAEKRDRLRCKCGWQRDKAKCGRKKENGFGLKSQNKIEEKEEDRELRPEREYEER